MGANYHLMIDDKFIDGFITAAEQVSDRENKYIITSSPPYQFIKSGLAVSAALETPALNKVIEAIGPGDRLFVHWYSDKLMGHLEKLNPEVALYLFFWGGDFLEQKKEFFDFNFEPLTKAYLQKRVRSRIFFRSKNPVQHLRQVKRLLHWKVSQFRTRRFQVRMRRNFLNRLNFFCHWNEADLERLKVAYTCNPAFKPFFYDTGFSRLPEELIKETESGKPVVWLGNSSTIPNNHIDAIQKISGYKKGISVVCPLSYGDKIYGDYISVLGKEKWGEDFSDLREFMPLDEYFSLLRNVDVVVMFHNRSQAAGNIFAFIRIGKKVYVKRESTIFTLLEKSGIHLYDANQIGEIPYEEFIKPLSKLQKEENRRIINKMFSEENRMNFMKEILDN